MGISRWISERIVDAMIAGLRKVWLAKRKKKARG